MKSKPDSVLYKERHREAGPSLRASIEKGDREGVILFFLPYVCRVARKYYPDQGSDEYMEAVSVGNAALVEEVIGRPLSYRRLQQFVTEAVENSIRDYLLEERADNIRLEYNTDRLKKVVVNPSGEIERQEIVESVHKLLRTLPYREHEVIKLRFGLGDDGIRYTLREIGEDFKLSIERIRGIEVGGMEKMETRITRKPGRYGACPRLYDYFTEVVLSSRDRKLADGRIDSDILLERVKKDIVSEFGMGLGSLMRFYGLSFNGLYHYLKTAYPTVSKWDIKEAVRIYEKEEKKSEDKRLKGVRERRDIEAIKTRLCGEGEGRLSAEEERDVFDAVRNLYTPLFTRDSLTCLHMLREEAESENNPEAMRKLFRKAHRYFSRIGVSEIDGITTDLDGFQRVDIDIISGRNAYIIASEMGTGKSVEAIAYAVKNGLRKVLIISTKSGAYSTWPRELHTHLEGEPQIALLDGHTLRNKKELKKASEANWFVATYGTAARYVDRLREMGFDLVVFDECHKINNDNTEQSMALTSLEPPRKLAISGSVFKNRREELFPLLHWLYPADFPSKDSFERTYCRDAKGLELLNYELGDRMVLRLKEEVLDLSPVKRVARKVPMPPELAGKYREMEEDFIEWYRRNHATIPRRLLKMAALAKMHGLRQLAIQAKTPVIDKIVGDVMREPGRKAVLYTTYVDSAEAFRARYARYGVCCIQGTTTNSERVKDIGNFEKDPEKRLFVITSAGGESIDLSSASDIIYANKPLTYADEKQVLDRLHRRGQKKAVTAFDVQTIGTIEGKIDKIIKRKRKEYEAVVHGSHSRMFFEDHAENVRAVLAEIVGR